MTPSAARLWSMLRGRKAGGFRFRREHVFEPYILDFYCAEVRLAVEVDGAVHGNEERQAYDARRDAFLEHSGLKVLRVPANALLHEPQDVVAWIMAECRARGR